MKTAFFTCAGIAFVSATITAAIAQQPAQNLPDAPSIAFMTEPEPMSAFLRPLPEPVEKPAKRIRWYKKSDNLVAIALAASEMVDGIGTHENMTHSRWLCGYDPNLVAGYRIGGSVYQPGSGPGPGIAKIATLCGPSPFGANENYAVDVTALDGSFSEGGWAARYVNNRNYAGVELLNIGLDGAGLMVGKLIPARGKWRWVKAAVTAVNYAHAAGHIYAGVGNFRYVNSPNQAASNFFASRPNPGFTLSVFPGPSWWGKQ